MGEKHAEWNDQKTGRDKKTILSCIICLSTKNLASTEQIQEELT